MQHPDPAARLWRVRKAHDSVEAVLVKTDKSGAEIQFLVNGDAVYRRTHASTELALAEAQVRLRELQRAGWALHW